MVEVKKHLRHAVDRLKQTVKDVLSDEHREDDHDNETPIEPVSTPAPGTRRSGDVT